jgi:uncharacterized protein (DUF433 family)
MIEFPPGLVTIDREIMGGEPVFAGTRVPVALLLEFLADDGSLDEFIEDYPTVTRKAAKDIMTALQRELVHR